MTTARNAAGSSSESRRRRAGRQVRPIVVQSVGKPEAVSSLARLLLARRQRPTVELVTDEQPSSRLPAIEQGPQ